MSTDLLKKLAAAVGVLVVLWLGSELLRSGPDSGATDLDIPELSAEAVDSIVIRGSQRHVSLTRSGADWTVNGLEAAYGGIGDLIAALNEGVTLNLTGRNPEMHARYELDDAQASRLTIYEGDRASVDLLTGKRGQDFQSLYVRQPGADDVFSARTRIASFVDRGVDDWRNKVILTIDPDSVHQVEVRRGTGSYGLVRQDSVWLLDGEEANGASVQTMLNQFRALNAVGFPTDAEQDSVDLDRPDRVLRLLGAGDQVMAEMTFDSTSSGFWTQRSGNDVVFRMDRFKVDQITPADSTLRHRENGAD